MDTIQTTNSTKDVYLEYIQKTLPAIHSTTLSKITLILEQSSWDHPDSSIDWNNLAVVMLTEAENAHDNLVMRSVYLEMAVDALNQGIEIDNHPLCALHLALIHQMIGEKSKALNIAFNSFIHTLQPAYTSCITHLPGLIFIPKYNKTPDENHQKCLEAIIIADDGYQQALFLLSEVLYRSQIAFYTHTSRRFLYLLVQLLPNSVDAQLKLGVSSFMGGLSEGLFYLHQARKLLPNSASVLQSLYLAYRDLHQTEISTYWQGIAAEFYQKNSLSQAWQWTQLPADSRFTYAPFAENLIVAVEPSLQSIATSVLITEQDWFEKEMEFWRNNIQPGMTVIDVGANVGVYTFSAALKVGSQGRVLAVEPFSGCVRCLQETRRINQLSWVQICAGAASDRNGTVKLLLHSANELNQVITEDSADNLSPESFDEVACFTLDSLLEQEKIEQVDFLKIDAEGHEMAVLAGSQKLIKQFQPVILYENIAGSQGSNLEVAEYLIKIGYELFHYQSYTQKLIPVESINDFQEQLNFIALPSKNNIA